MANDNKAEPIRRYLGKVRNTNTKNGVMQKIYMDNLNNVNADGTPNSFYKGALAWHDAETGKSYQVKQMSFWVPRDGMKPELLQKGYSCFITLNLADDYEVTVLG
jgi:hypothetical protein